jgi:hypothetical protein
MTQKLWAHGLAKSTAGPCCAVRGMLHKCGVTLRLKALNAWHDAMHSFVTITNSWQATFFNLDAAPGSAWSVAGFRDTTSNASNADTTSYQHASNANSKPNQPPVTVALVRPPSHSYGDQHSPQMIRAAAALLSTAQDAACGTSNPCQNNTPPMTSTALRWRLHVPKRTPRRIYTCVHAGSLVVPVADP